MPKQINSVENCLLIGGSGLLGANFIESYQDKDNIFYNRHETPLPLSRNVCNIDLYTPSSIEEFILKNNIKIIINFSGFTNVDECERQPDKAFLINSVIPKNLAISSERTDCKLIHISTDHLYKNSLGKNSEEDDVDLINQYAKSKFKGEEYIKENCDKFIILRTNFFCKGAVKKSFADWIRSNLGIEQELELFDDVNFNPVHSKKVFKTIEQLVSKNMYGLFNLSSNESISKYSFGLMVADQFKLNKNLIKKASIEDSKAIYAQRPTNMTLCNAKLLSKINLDLSIQSSLNAYKDEIIN